jgi:Leucine-rich repeat (LRR) protein
LEGLHLANTQVTDSGLENVKRLTNLEWVSLENTQITDAGLVHFTGMARLEDVNARGTQVRDETYREFRHALRNKESTVDRSRSEGPPP